MVRRHDKIRQRHLRRSARKDRGKLANDAAGTEDRQQIELRRSRSSGTLVGQIEDVALARSLDGAVRRVDKVGDVARMPVVAACLPRVFVHALLDSRPFALIGHEEAVQIKVKPILHCGAVDFGDQTAGAGQRNCIEADAVSERVQFIGRAARMPAAAAAHMDAEFSTQGSEPALEGADDARGDAG